MAVAWQARGRDTRMPYPRRPQRHSRTLQQVGFAHNAPALPCLQRTRGPLRRPSPFPVHRHPLTIAGALAAEAALGGNAVAQTTVAGSHALVTF